MGGPAEVVPSSRCCSLSALGLSVLRPHPPGGGGGDRSLVGQRQMEAWDLAAVCPSQSAPAGEEAWLCSKLSFCHCQPPKGGEICVLFAHVLSVWHLVDAQK